MRGKISEKRRASNAAYYARLKADPERMRARRAKEHVWRRENKLLVKEQAARRYERVRGMQLFSEKLDRLFEKVRWAEIERGRVPYDG